MNIKKHYGKPSWRDGYVPARWTCADCGAVIISARVGNGAGWRWFDNWARSAAAEHDCATHARTIEAKAKRREDLRKRRAARLADLAAASADRARQQILF
jgi:transcription initiation factor TFIIIB Brf1 subunit/transcription initiation factor TFIIB